MYSCAFFGHRDVDYTPYCEKIENILADLIENRGVTRFYSGNRGNFDKLCAYLVWDLKFRYPQIENILVLSYPSKSDFILPKFFDDAAYLLETHVPPKFAIPQTNRRMVDLADHIVSGVNRDRGGAFTACQYAEKRKKDIIRIYD